MQTRAAHPLYGGDFTTLPPVNPLPFVLPGELLETDPFTLLEPAATRVEPACVHFGYCGGCSYQHAAYPTQLQLKQQILMDTLTAAGLKSLPQIQTVQAEPWGYRNRIRLRVRHFDSAMQLGYNRRGTNHFLPIRMCPIAAPLLWHAAEALLQLAVGTGPAQRWLLSVSEVELFTTPTEDALQIQFFLGAPELARQARCGFEALCKALKAAIPQLIGAGAEPSPDLSRSTRRNAQPEQWGKSGLAYAAAGRPYWVSRGAFFQVNRFLVESLTSLVAQNATGLPATGQLAWDLFAGVGLFSRILATGFQQVIAVEGAEIAAADLALVAKTSAGVITAVHQPTLDFLKAQTTQRARPDLVVLDPPRAGLGAEAAGLLAAIAPDRITYVSCDPTSLARDLALLAPAYTLASMHLVDMFPQTFHLETVVHLTHRRAAQSQAAPAATLVS